MNSSFSHSVDSLKRISGSSSQDLDLASSAAGEMETFVNTQAHVIDEYVDLRRILTSASEVEIKDAITSMRHVAAALADLAQFHRSGLLVDAFDPAQHRANQVLVAAKQKAGALLAQIER